MALKRKASFAELVEENREQILQDREQMDEIEAKLEKEKRVSLRKLD
ncbi:MAG TPA: FbpB family small basic protein [Virgibacillus sp.]|nr:FbpB family small basic protein [Virgibacillus sp.]